MKESPFKDLLSLKDAAEYCGVEESTLRKAISKKIFIEDQDIKKFGKQWVITKDAINREYFKHIEKLNKRKEVEEFLKNRLIFETINEYIKQNKLSREKTIKLFNQNNIIKHLIDNYEYYHLQGTNKTAIDIKKRIEK